MERIACKRKTKKRLNRPSFYAHQQLIKTTRATALFLMLLLPFAIYAQTGPGGVGNTNGSSTLEYWIDANNGLVGASPVSAWSDLSGNGVNNTIHGNPSLSANALNGYDAIDFDGSGDYITTNLNINAGTRPNLSVIAVYRPQTNNAGGVWGEDNGGWDRFLFDKANVNSTYADAVSNGQGPISNIPNIFPVGSAVITTVTFQEDVNNGTRVYANSDEVRRFSSNHAPESSNTFAIGDIGSLGGAFHFNGDIAELMVYRHSLNTAQRIIINNYLSAKYGLSLAADDIYRQDASNRGNYDHDVAGIGRINPSNIHSQAQGTGIVRIANPSNLGNNEFLLWGHDNGTLQMNETSDIPATLLARLDRVWRVNEVNRSGSAVNVGAVDMRFNLSGIAGVNATDLRLLVDTDNDGDFDDETPIAGATATGGNNYQFAGVTALTNNRRFTLGLFNVLPIELLSFEAQITDEKQVELLWETASEINNDYFTIERSKDAVNWEVLGTLDAVGNSSQVEKYSLTDKQPLPTVSYYRLKQTDIDGQFSYSSIQSISLNENQTEVELYPNPTKGILRLSGVQTQLNTVEVYNALGQNVSTHVRISRIDEQSLELDLSALKAGTYYVKTADAMHKVHKQ